MAGARTRFSLLLLLVALFLGACREQGDINIHSLDFQGVKQVDKKALAAVLQTKRGSKLPWGHKTYFDRRAFEADLERLQAFYRDRGFPDARVSSFDVKLNDKQDQVDVIVRISEGQPTLVAGIDLTGFDVLSPGELRSLRDSLPLQVKKPLDRQLAVASRERALNALSDRGYPYAEVDISQQGAGAEVDISQQGAGGNQVRVAFAATPGMLAHFGPIEIAGEKSVGENIVRRQLTYNTGEVFSRREMRESQRKLYGMELFQFANIESKEDKTQQLSEVPTLVTVAEGKHRRLTTGIGYGSEEKARATLRWDHLNFFGNARHAGVETKWSSLDRGVRLEYTEPYFISSHFSMNFEGGAWQAAEPVYSLNTLGGRAAIRHQSNSQNYWAVSLINEFQRSSISNAGLEDFSIRNNLIALGLDPRTGLTRGTTAAVAFDINRNTTNNLLDANRGYSLSGHLEQAGKWLWGTYNYWEVTAEARQYTLVARSFVWANRLHLGTIDALGNSSTVPFFKRYFLGGATSIRGWGRFEVSPLSGFGLPIGGLSMFEGSTEIRKPLFGKLGAVGFFDFGNVSRQSLRFATDSPVYAAGPGLRYLTPVGPARIDFGYQLNRIPNLLVNGQPEARHWRIHFSIGQAF
jgi:outer membrane protein insertion porin family/translocation and assembly module TamA